MGRDRWRLLVTRGLRGSLNMAIDHVLAATAKPGSSPVLRLYDWNPPAISLGFHQRASDIDLSRARDCGIDVVRRPTGGRAVLHAEELTYSLVVPAGPSSFSPRPHQVYQTASHCFRRALALLGLPAELETSERGQSPPARSVGGIPCFAASARHELKLHGKKILGSAQRRYPGAVLQHGSLLLGPAHLKLTSFLSLGEEEKRRLHELLRLRTACLQEAVGRSFSFEEVATAVVTAFREELGIDFAFEGLSEEEFSLARQQEASFVVEGGDRHAEDVGDRVGHFALRRDFSWSAGFPLRHLLAPGDRCEG